MTNPNLRSVEPSTLKLAVLIDADNAQPSIIAALLAEIATYGEATVKRIYGDFTASASAGWKKVLQNHAIKPVQQYAYTTGKNATDSTMIIDAMDLLYTRRFDGFCLVSSDSDFTGLALRIREEGLLVFGFGEEKTPEAFRNACHKFVLTEVLRPRVEPPLTSPPAPPVVAPPLPAPSTITIANGVQTALATLAATPEPPAPPKSTTPVVPRKFLLTALSNTPADDAGWVHLGAFGGYLNKVKSDFDPRIYGFKKLSDLIRTMTKDIEIDERPPGSSTSKALYIRRRGAG